MTRSTRATAVHPVGTRFGRLTVLGHGWTYPTGRPRVRHYEVQCDCGARVAVNRGNLVSGNTTSCGCLQRDRPNNTRHGMTGTQVHNTWAGIRQRCENPNDPAYKHYGGRGIALHPQWAEFENFYAAVGDPPFDGASLDRIDNDGNYEPGNVRWATRTTQARNRRGVRMVAYEGREQCVAEWAEEIGVSASALRHRLDAGWDTAVALTHPIRESRRENNAH